MEEQKLQEMALQAIGEYMMGHIAGIMEMVQDKSFLHQDEELDEETLTAIEKRVKAIAEALTYQSTRQGIPAGSQAENLQVREAFNELLASVSDSSGNK
ncbi:hypothetical protein [Dictyobacter kobayashii]|uniref:Uncharacterized protein n=1 Tax=Dictyobacter kobayashii TaxID=2014872 RepID=A0A402AYR3_9CHLR|nr:hypothetical protein [Dictyobacter kobayashii]GCE24242.1 hypothetical protein KDK_80420 [Dictyobacter kobayashii]